MDWTSWDPWEDISEEMILSTRRTIDEVLCKESEDCFNSEEWVELMGLGFKIKRKWVEQRPLFYKGPGSVCSFTSGIHIF